MIEMYPMIGWFALVGSSVGGVLFLADTFFAWWCDREVSRLLYGVAEVRHDHHMLTADEFVTPYRTELYGELK